MTSEVKRKKHKKTSFISFGVQREDEWEDGNVSKRKVMCLEINHIDQKRKMSRSDFTVAQLLSGICPVSLASEFIPT